MSWTSKKLGVLAGVFLRKKLNWHGRSEGTGLAHVERGQPGVEVERRQVPQIEYDDKRDVLYAYLSDSGDSLAVEVKEGILIRVTSSNAPAVTGLTIIDFSRRFSGETPSEVVQRLLDEYAAKALDSIRAGRRAASTVGA